MRPINFLSLPAQIQKIFPGKLHGLLPASANSELDHQADEQSSIPTDSQNLMDRMAVTQTTTNRWSLQETFCGCLEQGIRGVGLSYDLLKQRGLEYVIEEINRYDLSVSSLGWVGGFTGGNGISWEQAVRDAKLAIWVASQVGAQAVNVRSGPIGSHIHKHASRIVVQALQQLAPYAAQLGVRLALYPMHHVYAARWTFLHSIDDALTILDAVNHPGVGLGFGPYHVWGEARLTQRLPELASRIAMVQLSDWHRPPQHDGDRALPGDGCIPFPQLIASLESAGYRGMYEIDASLTEQTDCDLHQLLDECRSRCETFCRW